MYLCTTRTWHRIMKIKKIFSLLVGILQHIQHICSTLQILKYSIWNFKLLFWPCQNFRMEVAWWATRPKFLPKNRHFLSIFYSMMMVHSGGIQRGKSDESLLLSPVSNIYHEIHFLLSTKSRFKFKSWGNI